eukprot:7160961-Prymnesium_polylepis.1
MADLGGLGRLARKTEIVKKGALHDPILTQQRPMPSSSRQTSPDSTTTRSSHRGGWAETVSVYRVKLIGQKKWMRRLFRGCGTEFTGRTCILTYAVDRLHCTLSPQTPPRPYRVPVLVGTEQMDPWSLVLGDLVMLKEQVSKRKAQASRAVVQAIHHSVQPALLQPLHSRETSFARAVVSFKLLLLDDQLSPTERGGKVGFGVRLFSRLRHDGD